MPKKLITGVIFLILIVIIVNLGRQISTALNSGSRLDTAALELSALQEQNQKLQQQLKSVGTADFVEKIARNDLNMSKTGESVVIIPQNVIDQVLNSEKKFTPLPIPNWQGWLKLIFH